MSQEVVCLEPSFRTGHTQDYTAKIDSGDQKHNNCGNGSYFMWPPQIREAHIVCNLLLHHEDLILNKFRIDGIFGGENLTSCVIGWKIPNIVSRPGFEPPTHQDHEYESPMLLPRRQSNTVQVHETFKPWPGCLHCSILNRPTVLAEYPTKSYLFTASWVHKINYRELTYPTMIFQTCLVVQMFRNNQ